MEFTVLKTRIIISPVFFMVLTTILLVDKFGIALPVILFSVCHEIGHFFALFCTKTVAKVIRISIFGIQIELPSNLSSGKKIIIFAAGFIVNFILGAAFFVNGYILYAYINLLIGIFTAFPISSTDGGSVLSVAFEELSAENSETVIKNINLIFSFVTIFFLCVTAFFTQNILLSLPIVYILIMALKKSY